MTHTLMTHVLTTIFTTGPAATPTAVPSPTATATSGSSTLSTITGYLGIFIGAAVGLTNLLPSLFYGMVMAGIFSAVLIVAKRAGRPNVPEYISYGTFLCLGALGHLVLWGLGGG